LQFCGTLDPALSLDDISLFHVVEIWPSLPEHIKLAIQALVDAASRNPEVTDD